MRAACDRSSSCALFGAVGGKKTLLNDVRVSTYFHFVSHLPKIGNFQMGYKIYEISNWRAQCAGPHCWPIAILKCIWSFVRDTDAGAFLRFLFFCVSTSQTNTVCCSERRSIELSKTFIWITSTYVKNGCRSREARPQCSNAFSQDRESDECEQWVPH